MRVSADTPFRDVGYARLSHADPDETGAIARQKQDIRRVSEHTGGRLVCPILSDNAISASRYARRKRKDYPRLLEMARAGLADRAVIYDVDRLLRIPRELEDLIDLVEELDGQFTVVGVTGVLDLSTADGRFFARMRVAQAAKESDDMSRRLRRTFDQLADAGLPKSVSGSRRVFGWQDGGLVPEPAEAALIQQAAADVLAGVGLNTVAARWNQAGVRTALDGMWSNRTVRRTLLSLRNAGRREHRGQDHGEAVWPPIIDPAVREQLHRLLTERSREPGRRTPFTGLFVATDGRKMRRQVVGRQKRHAYRTWSYPGVDQGPSVTISPAEVLEELVLEMMFVDIESGGIARRVSARRRSAPTAPGEDAAGIRREMEELAADVGEGRMTRQEWLRMRGPLERRLAAAEAAAARAADVDVLERLDLDVRGRWSRPVSEGGYDDQRKRRILHSVFERVEIAPAARLGSGFDSSRVRPIYRG